MSELISARKTHWGQAFLVIVLAMVGGVGYEVVQTVRGTVQLMKAGDQLHDIDGAIVQYAGEHEGRLPDTLGNLVVGTYLKPESLIVPWGSATIAAGATANDRGRQVDAGGHSSFIYTGAGLRAGNSIDDVVICYIDDGPSPHGVTLCGFGDGHSETMTVPELMKFSVVPLIKRSAGILNHSTEAPTTQPRDANAKTPEGSTPTAPPP